ncbi:MAG: hypothetical protein ACI4S3_07285 [Candidatus Gastranaerophilaceae bacterium]
MKHNSNILRKIAKEQYNIELVLRHNQRMERALKQIIKRLESGYPDKEKIKSIEKILETVKDYI